MSVLRFRFRSDPPLKAKPDRFTELFEGCAAAILCDYGLYRQGVYGFLRELYYRRKRWGYAPEVGGEMPAYLEVFDADEVLIEYRAKIDYSINPKPIHSGWLIETFRFSRGVPLINQGNIGAGLDVLIDDVGKYVVENLRGF